MGILRIVCLLVFSLLLSLGNASAAGWTAGPGLTPSDDFPLFKTVEKRLGLSTAKIPHSGKELPIELRVFFNEEMDRAAERYLQALNKESSRCLCPAAGSKTRCRYCTCKNNYCHFHCFTEIHFLTS